MSMLCVNNPTAPHNITWPFTNKNATNICPEPVEERGTQNSALYQIKTNNIFFFKTDLFVKKKYSHHFEVA